MDWLLHRQAALGHLGSPAIGQETRNALQVNALLSIGLSYQDICVMPAIEARKQLIIAEVRAAG